MSESASWQQTRLRVLSEDVAEMLERVRACFKVIRHVRPKMSCDACDWIVQASAPSRPIDHGLADPVLLAHVLVSKYADHVPPCRQSEIYAHEGVDPDRSALAGWVGATSELLAPLVEGPCSRDVGEQARRPPHQQDR